MKTLLILRHAKSSWKNLDQDDHDRPLNKRGKRDAPRMGAVLKDEGLVPDRIICSTAKRARKTAEAVAEACGFAGTIEREREFYHAPPGAYLAHLRTLPKSVETALVVGHNPGMESLLQRLTRETDAFPTAALAQVELKIKSWADLDADGKAKLVNLWIPKELP
jgi:phosphohistidine phosphatase